MNKADRRAVEAVEMKIFYDMLLDISAKNEYAMTVFERN
jgi:hypothetical protein